MADNNKQASPWYIFKAFYDTKNGSVELSHHCHLKGCALFNFSHQWGHLSSPHYVMLWVLLFPLSMFSKNIYLVHVPIVSFFLWSNNIPRIDTLLGGGTVSGFKSRASHNTMQMFPTKTPSLDTVHFVHPLSTVWVVSTFGLLWHTSIMNIQKHTWTYNEKFNGWVTGFGMTC